MNITPNDQVYLTLEDRYKASAELFIKVYREYLCLDCFCGCVPNNAPFNYTESANFINVIKSSLVKSVIIGLYSTLREKNKTKNSDKVQIIKISEDIIKDFEVIRDSYCDAYPWPSQARKECNLFLAHIKRHKRQIESNLLYINLPDIRNKIFAHISLNNDGGVRIMKLGDIGTFQFYLLEDLIKNMKHFYQFIGKILNVHSRDIEDAPENASRWVTDFMYKVRYSDPINI